MQTGKKLNMDRVVARMQAATSLIVASIQDYKEISPNLCKVVVAFNTNDADNSQRFNALAALFQGHARPVEGSFRWIPNAAVPAAVGFIARNVEIKPYVAAAAASFKAMASNLLMDETDNSLWEVHTAGEDKYLARHSEESLAELVALASLKNEHHRHDIPALARLATADAQSNEYVAYVHPQNLELSHGYVMATDSASEEGSEDTMQVVDVESQDRVDLNPELVVESAFLNGSDLEYIRSKQIAVTFSPDTWNAAEMKAYYRQVFSYAPEYLRELEKIIDSHSVV